MSRSIRDLRELICLSRFGFRPDEIVPQEEIQTASPKTNILFYFDPSILDSWLELTSTRMDRLRSLTSHSLVDFIHFWLTQFDDQHKLSLFQMEFELFVEHLTLAFTPNDTDAKQINEFARNILHDIDFQQNDPSLPENNRKLIRIIDIFNRSKRDDEYRHLLANLPVHLTEQTNDHLHLQWMLAIRAFALVSLCVSAVEFFEKIQETLDKVRHRGDERPTGGADRTLFDNFSQQMKDRVVAALRKDFVDVINYFIETNQVPGDGLDEQNRNVLFHALPLGNEKMVELILKSAEKLAEFDINSIPVSGNSVVHVCVTLQRVDFLGLLLKHFPNVDLNKKNHQDATALHLSIIFDNVEMARFLLQSGADEKLTMKSKDSLKLSIEFGNPSMIELFSKVV